MRRIEDIMEAVSEHAWGIAKVLAIIAGLLTLKDWTTNSKGPPIAYALIIFIFLVPIYHLVFAVLMLLVKAAIEIIFAIVHAKRRKERKKREYEERQEWQERWEKEQERQREEQKRHEREKEKQEKQEREREEQEQKEKEKKKQQQSQSGPKKRRPPTELECAMYWYNIRRPFTYDELKRARRRVMKTVHPDVGGSTKKAEQMNHYFELLAEVAEDGPKKRKEN